MKPEQENALINGGVNDLHSHPHIVTQDQLHRLQELEKVVFISTNYTVQSLDDIVFVDATCTITLPFAVGGRHVTIVSTNVSATVTVVPQSGETINGTTSYIINTNYKPLRLKAIKGVGYLEI